MFQKSGIVDVYILQSDFVLGISVTLTDGEPGFMLVVLTDGEPGLMLVVLTKDESGFMLVVLTDGESGFIVVGTGDAESGFLHLGNMTCFGYFVYSLYENTRIYLQGMMESFCEHKLHYSC